MICETCHGTGFSTPRWNPWLPCEVCGGSGRDYCCQGSERYGQGGLSGKVPGLRSKRMSTGDGVAFDTTNPPPLRMTEAELLAGLQDMGLGVFED
jgi:hypothetical protein